MSRLGQNQRNQCACIRSALARSSDVSGARWHFAFGRWDCEAKFAPPHVQAYAEEKAWRRRHTPQIAGVSRSTRLRPTRVLGSPELGRYSDGVLNCAASEKCDAVHRNIFPAGL
jgi:hypothetical protein